jgi:uncharacterized protein (DUF433 family)
MTIETLLLVLGLVLGVSALVIAFRSLGLSHRVREWSKERRIDGGPVHDRGHATNTASGIIRDPRIMMGKPVIKGTHITVELILTRLGEGRSVDDILAEYPHLTRKQVTAAIEYARARRLS